MRRRVMRPNVRSPSRPTLRLPTMPGAICFSSSTSIGAERKRSIGVRWNSRPMTLKLSSISGVRSLLTVNWIRLPG
jgi:hypothetical protein